jgi:hypothetical protein
MRAFDRDLIRGGHYASGHVNRANRPNTWLHRLRLQREDSPCQLGAVHTWHKADITIVLTMSAIGGKADIVWTERNVRL